MVSILPAGSENVLGASSETVGEELIKLNTLGDKIDEILEILRAPVFRTNVGVSAMQSENKQPPSQPKMATATPDIDVWTINIVKLLLHNGPTLPVATVMDWAKKQCKENKQKIPSVKNKIKDGIGRYFSVSDGPLTKADVTLDIPVKLCDRYWTANGCAQPCGNIHICKYFILDNCRTKTCRFIHLFQESANLSVIVNNGLGFLREEELKKLWLRQVNLPDVCKFYNSEGGCKKATGKPCPAMHLCRYFLKGQCKFDDCIRSHDVSNEQPLRILKSLGWDMSRSPDSILRELTQRFAEKDAKEKQPTQQTASIPQRKSGYARSASSIEGQVAQHAESAKSAARPRAEKGESAEMKICTFYLKGKCSYGDKCRKVHYKKPFLWQYSDRRPAEGRGKWQEKVEEEWQSFSEEDNESIELCYVDVQKNTCFAQLLYTQDKAAAAGNPVVSLDFKLMTFSGKLEGKPLIGRVRRVGTYSWGEEALTRPYLTRWMWYWQDEQEEWRKYGEQEQESKLSKASVTSKEIEEKFLEKDGLNMNFQAGIHKYQINFKEMFQINPKYGTKRPIRRRPEPVTSSSSKPPVSPSSSEGVGMKSVEISFPPTWDPSAPSTHQDYQLVQLSASGPHRKEWDRVVGLVHQSLPDTAVKAVSRIQNYELWEDYVRKRSKMQKSRKAGDSVKELELFHGTKAEFIDPICQQGFDCRLAGSTVGYIHGKGSYFAKTAAYSLSYAQTSSVFVVKVLVGDYTKGSPSYTRPPPKDPSQPYKDLYDSCVDNLEDPKKFVVFEKAQSYPEYLVYI